MKILSARYKNDTLINMSASIVLCFNLINGAIGIDGVGLVTLFFVLFLLIVSSYRNPILISKVTICIVMLISLFFGISFLCVSNTDFTTEYFLYFISFGTVALIVGEQSVNLKSVLKYSSFIGFVCTAVIFFVHGIEKYNASIQMGITYSMLPVLVASYILLKYIHKFYIISIFNALLISYIYLNIAPRGIWVSILIYVVFSIIFIYLKYENNWQHITRFLALTILFWGIAVFVINNVYQMIAFIDDIYQVITGNRIYAIAKLMFFLNNDADVSNGREYLWNQALDIIESSPIVGNGIGYFESVFGGYTHNFILQSLCEGGVIFCVPIIFFVIMCMCMMNEIVRKDKVEFFFYNMLFVNGIVVLLYSSAYWKMFTFWYLLGYTIRFYRNNFNSALGTMRE